MFQKLRHRIDKKVLRRFGRLISRIDQKSLIDSFRNIGLERGATVCVHSSLSRLGEVVGGAEAVIDALMETIGTEGCILMPSFPMAGSMVRYLDQGEPFDIRHSPSCVGLVTEVFRKRPGVLRSLHPTHPLTAWGSRAEAFLRDHEKSPTPYGYDTPYGRLAKEENSFILMIEAHIHSLLHHLQERVQFPTLFLPEEREAAFIDKNGQKGAMRTKVMRPRIPYFVAIPSISGPEPDWAILHDFTLNFPKRRTREIQRLGYRFDGYQCLYQRRAEFEKARILSTTWIGRGEIGLLHVKGFLSRIEPELHELIERFRPFYDPERIAALSLPYS